MSTTKKTRPKGLKVELTGGRKSPPTTSQNLTNEKLTTNSKIRLKDEDLIFIHELGAGSGGTVSKVLHKPTNTVMARKIINVFVTDETERERTERSLLRELKILRVCKSPFIVDFHGAFAHEGDISICMENMDLGSLDYISRVLGPIPEDIVAIITVSVLKGLLYLFEVHKIVHRDIKPSNILLNSNGQIKIADFGVSKELVNTMARTFTGTQGYLAPERIGEGRQHSAESDIWSLGLTIMELATARFPFPPEGCAPLPSVLDLLRYIEEEPSPRLPAGRFSPEFERFVERCLIKDPDQRPSSKELLEDVFCTNAIAKGLDLSAWAKDVQKRLEK